MCSFTCCFSQSEHTAQYKKIKSTVLQAYRVKTSLYILSEINANNANNNTCNN